MQVQFNSDSSVMGTDNVAERIGAVVRSKLKRHAERLTRVEVHVRDENARKGGGDDKACTIEARPRSGSALGVTAHAGDVDTAARLAADKLAQRLDSHFGKADRHTKAPPPAED